ncbi:adenylate/guanylate cyclase domain-containing protein [Comamonadaceae bacterium G21597-S1]|nr:adenylate/guanylate cyclase domain-containing protein [Comamonadaceae bacterium G21597-S1]
MTPRTRRTLLQVIPFGLMWLVFGLIYTLIEKGILGDSPIYPSTGNPYDFSSGLISSLVLTTCTGLMVGLFEVRILNRLFVRRSFGMKIAFKALVYLAIIIAFLIAATTISRAQHFDTHLGDPILWNTAWNFFSSFAFWSVALFIAALMVIASFFSDISDNLGQGVLYHYLTGTYHRPIQEERIFMFLDMKSSTTFAEQLGHVRYFEMLKAYYADLSDSIIDHGGDIYQYVGDEIVVTWTMAEGLRNNNCIRCFFAMRAALAGRSGYYHRTYGLVPTFKAGLHCGNVTTGEIGVIKTDIIFTGDVLNTTARIEALCNGLGVDHLVSEQLARQLAPDPALQAKPLGRVGLRGKDEQVSLFTFEPA